MFCYQRDSRLKGKRKCGIRVSTGARLLRKFILKTLARRARNHSHVLWNSIFRKTEQEECTFLSTLSRRTVSIHRGKYHWRSCRDLCYCFRCRHIRDANIYPGIYFNAAARFHPTIWITLWQKHLQSANAGRATEILTLVHKGAKRMLQ